MKKIISPRERTANVFLAINRIATLFIAVLFLFPGFNPSRVFTKISTNISFLTSATSFSTYTNDMKSEINANVVPESLLRSISTMAWIAIAAYIVLIVGVCMTLGNIRYKKLGNWITIAGALGIGGALFGVYSGYLQAKEIAARYSEELESFFSPGFVFFLGAIVLVVLVALAAQAILPATEKGTKFEMPAKYKLFLMFMPFAALCFAFAYLPLWGWRFAFYEQVYTIPEQVTNETPLLQILFGDNMGGFIGMKYFNMFVQDKAYVAQIMRVMKNTLIMSGLGILTSWCPMAIAILLAEIKNSAFVRVIQTVTTIPNFISWVLVYAVALAIFANDGFINTFMASIDENYKSIQFLEDPSGIWFKMLLWGMWKGLGWSAIIYVAALSGIDQQLYEAATVDGAGRFQKMWYISLPGLLPTYMVLLLLSIASILSNGMEQYFVFKNNANAQDIEVLDLYVYQIGIKDSQISLSTVVGMAKTLISVTLLFMANSISKLLRGESIV